MHCRHVPSHLKGRKPPATTCIKTLLYLRAGGEKSVGGRRMDEDCE